MDANAIVADIDGLLLIFLIIAGNVNLNYGIKKGWEMLKENKKGGLLAYVLWIFVGMVIGLIIASIYLKPIICR